VSTDGAGGYTHAQMSFLDQVKAHKSGTQIELRTRRGSRRTLTITLS
jgi:hypothetical protein